MLRLASGGDARAAAVDRDVVDVARVLRRPARRPALVERGRERELARRDAGLEGEVVAERPVGERARRPRRPVHDVGLDLGEVGARGVHRGLQEDLRPVGGLRLREARQRAAAELLVEAGERAGEAGVVVGGDLVLHEVAAVVDVLVIGGVRAANQRAVEDVPAGRRLVDVVGPGAVRGAVVRVARRAGPEADHVAAPARVVAEDVVDLPHREVVVAGLAGGVGDAVGVEEGSERGVGRVAQRSPAVQPRLPAGRVGDPLPVHAHRPPVQPAVGVVEVALLAGERVEQHVGAVGLVVPGERPAVGLGRGLRLVAEVVVVGLGLLEVAGVAGGAVQPDRAPHQLVVEAAEGLVVAARVGNALVVAPPHRVSEGVQLAGVADERVGVGGVGGPEGDRGGRHRRRGLAGQVGAAAARVDPVGGARHRHHLGRPPPGVVRAAVAHLPVEDVRGGVGLDEVVSRPLDVREDLVELPRLLVRLAVIDHAPREHRDRERHGEAELHVVTGVVPAAGEVQADVSAVVQARVAPPVDAVARREPARALRVVEPDRFLQRLAVVERRGLRAHGRAHQRDQPERHAERQGHGKPAPAAGPLPPPGYAAWSHELLLGTALRGGGWDGRGVGGGQGRRPPGRARDQPNSWA